MTKTIKVPTKRLDQKKNFSITGTGGKIEKVTARPNEPIVEKPPEEPIPKMIKVPVQKKAKKKTTKRK